MDSARRRLNSALLEDDQRLLALLRSGDEAAFVALVKRYHRPLVRLAVSFVKREDVAEEVAQDAWQGLLESLERFTPQASLKTWLYRILINCARARQRKERHSVPLSSLGSDDPDGPAVSPDRFSPQGHVWEGHWASPPRQFVLGDPAISAEVRALLREAIGSLPEPHGQVMLLRDVEGWSSEEVCDACDLTESNQRVILHRARSKVRAFLEQRLGGEVQ
jgi:RNA polymerase sigma-70 factor (ECF subfamily)